MSDHGLGRIGLWTFDLDVQPMSLAQEAAQRIEEMGFSTVWVPEAIGREPFASCGVLLSATKTLKMATGIANIHARTAHTMQAGWRTLTEAFPDRFILGLGVSHQPMVEGAHKATYNKPYSTMVEYLDRMDEGLFFAAAPTVQPRRVLAALGPKMLKLSAERSLGAHPYFTPVEHTVIARKELGDGPLLAPEVAVIFETDATVAREIARKYMATYLRLPNYTNNLKRLGWTEEDITGASDAIVDAICAWGTTDQVISRIKAHLDAGADHVCVQVLTANQKQLPFALWEELAAATKGL
jgi:probable F420-dependent oxidoreductase